MVYLPHAAEAARLSRSVRIRIFLNFSINVKYLPSCESSKLPWFVINRGRFKTIYQPFNIRLK